MANYPFIDITANNVIKTTWEPPREYEWDYKTGKFIVRNGRIYILEGIEALRIWIYKCLLANRGRYQAYSWDYGTDLESLIGSGLTREAIVSESKRMVKDALFMNPHIKEIIDFKVTFGGIGEGNVVYGDSTLLMVFTVISDCGDINIKF